MKIGILGSRGVTVDWVELDGFIVNGFHKNKKIDEIVTGGAIGAATPCGNSCRTMRAASAARR